MLFFFLTRHFLSMSWIRFVLVLLRMYFCVCTMYMYFCIRMFCSVWWRTSPVSGKISNFSSPVENLQLEDQSGKKLPKQTGKSKEEVTRSVSSFFFFNRSCKDDTQSREAFQIFSSIFSLSQWLSFVVLFHKYFQIKTALFATWKVEWILGICAATHSEKHLICQITKLFFET